MNGEQEEWLHISILVLYRIRMMNNRFFTASASKHYRIRRCGFSFLEVLAAIIVLGLGIIPVFMVFSRGSQGTIMTRDETQAHQLASEMLDTAIAMGYDHPAFLANGGTIEVPATALANIGGGHPRFTRSLNVREVLPGGGIGDWPMSYKVLIATVKWEHSGVKQFFNLTTLLFKGYQAPK
jgi:type II secretory pathway pseudopilin PulG